MSDRAPTGHRPNAVDVLRLFDFEQIAPGRYRTACAHAPGPRLYGGQLIAQSLAAAQSTVLESRYAHSLHLYFVRPGRQGVPIEYWVMRDRDGRSFSARRVEAWQDGKLLATLSASFHDDEPGMEHQFPKPDVPGPETLESLRSVIDPVVDRFPDSLRDFWRCDMGIEFRAVEPFMPFAGEPRPPVRNFWMRATDLPVHASRAMHRAVLAYASDMHILDTGLLPLGVGWAEPTRGDASLDHALWFHGDFQMDDWLLYAMDSPRAYGNRSLGRGLIYTRDGTLVASVTQEGLIRLRVQHGGASD